MKWSIAASAKSLETIQAIINMQYWAPVSQKQSDDTYWLHISHVRITLYCSLQVMKQY